MLQLWVDGWLSFCGCHVAARAVDVETIEKNSTRVSTTVRMRGISLSFGRSQCRTVAISSESCT